MQRNRSKPTLKDARQTVEYWDRLHREREAELAQTAYLEALAYADWRTKLVARSFRNLSKAKRQAAVAAELRYIRRMLREARNYANHPTRYGQRVTGRDISEISRTNTVPRDSRRLAGIRGSATRSRVNTMSIFGQQERTEYATLRSSGGRILATVIVAGQERELYARLLAALGNARA